MKFDKSVTNAEIQLHTDKTWPLTKTPPKGRSCVVSFEYKLRYSLVVSETHLCSEIQTSRIAMAAELLTVGTIDWQKEG